MSPTDPPPKPAQAVGVSSDPGGAISQQDVASPQSSMPDTSSPVSSTLIPSPVASPGSSGLGSPGVSQTGSLTGQSFGDYELIEQIGRGAMGVVYKGLQKSLDRIVAIKMMPVEHMMDKVRLERFVSEARAAARLTHPNIVTIYQVGESPWGHFFAMEYVDGQSLDKLLAVRRDIPIAWAVSCMIPICEAVHHAHTKGIIHRDLKPGNIMLDSSQRPKVMDFGIAKFLGQSSSATYQGEVVGTPSYMSPEQASGAKNLISPASDVYSLGAVLYRLLAGEPPFAGETAVATILRVLSAEAPPVRKLRSDVPAELETICMRCLKKRPEERYASAHSLALDMRRFRATVKAPTPSAPAPRIRPLSVLLVSEPAGNQVRLSKELNVLGRANDCDVVLKAADVSKHHCQILIGPDFIVVEDLGSANGTKINDVPIRKTVLQDGDKLQIGKHAFRVRLQKNAAPRTE